MKKSYVEIKMTGPNTERTVIFNAVRTEPEGKKPGTFELYFKIEPEPPEDEKAADRTPEEDLMHFLLNALLKGVQK